MRLKDLGKEKIRRAKAQLELNVAAAVKDTKNASTNPSPTKGGCGGESPSFIQFRTDFQEEGAGGFADRSPAGSPPFIKSLSLVPVADTLNFSGFICPC